jgi:putative oxidoreductase
MNKLKRICSTHAPAAVILIRLMIGLVFVSEGIQKFLFADIRGTGRFAKLGIPSPEFFGPLVGATEIVCGALVVVGLLTRLAAVPLLVVMTVAIYTTKLVPFAANGFWKTAHDGRTDSSMLLGLLFLLIVGGGRWSLDTLFSATPKPHGGAATE